MQTKSKSMADFKTHLQVGSALGFLLAVFTHVWGWVNNFSTAIIIFFATSLGAFLPDMDSNSSLPVKIISLLYAYLVSALVLFYFYDNGYKNFFFLAAAGLIAFLAVFKILPVILKKYTRHRGIFHSIPAFLISFFLTLIIAWTTRLSVLERFSMALAVSLGYLSHLVLDEIYSVDLFNKKIEGKKQKFYVIKIKKSSGTALDWGFDPKHKFEAIVAYVILFALIVISFPYLKEIFEALRK